MTADRTTAYWKVTRQNEEGGEPLKVTRQPLDLAVLMRAGGVTGLDVSPDGRWVVCGATAKGPSRLYVQPIEGGAAREITSGEEAASNPEWSPRGDLIAFLQDVGGDENYQVYVMRPDGSERKNLTNATGKLHENHSWSWDGTRVAYVSTRDGQFDVYYSDLEGGVHRVTDFPTVHHAPEFSPDGTRMSYASNRTEMAANWDTFVMNLSERVERKVTEHEGEADEMSYYACQSPRWSLNGKEILVSSSVPGNYDIMGIDVDTLERRWIANGAWDELNAQWSSDGTRVAYVVNEDASWIIHVKDLESNRAWPVSPPTGVAGQFSMRGHGGNYRWTPDGESIVYSYIGPREPASIRVVPAEGGESRTIYSAMPEGLDPDALVTPELIHYSSFDGRRISALLHRPKDSDGPVPAVLIPHGGPTGQTNNCWQPASQYLASLGFAVLQPNFRGSTGYGTEFQWLNRFDLGGGDLKDVVAGGEWLVRQGIASDLAIAGTSYGGFLTLSAVARYPDMWRAAVSLMGMSNLVPTDETRLDMIRFMERLMGPYAENQEPYHERSPVNHADKVSCPVLLIQTERDPRVHMNQATQMERALQAAGKEVELIMYQNEGHGMARLDTRIGMIKHMAEFIQRHMKNTDHG